MPDKSIPASPTGGEAPDSSDLPDESADDPDGPAAAEAALRELSPVPPSAKDGARRGRIGRLFPNTPLWRFLSYVRPHSWLVAGGAMMGVLKFTLPLMFPLAFKYVIDVLLVPQPKMDHINSLIDRGCVSLAAVLHLGTGAIPKLEALTAAMFVIFFVQAISTYYPQLLG